MEGRGESGNNDQSKRGRKGGRKYFSEQTGSQSYSVGEILNSSQPVECQLTGTESHWLPSFLLSTQTLKTNWWIICSCLLTVAYNAQVTIHLKIRRRIPVCNYVTLYVEANLGVSQAKGESGLKRGCRKADPCSAARVVPAGAGHSLQGQRATPSQPLSRIQERGHPSSSCSCAAKQSCCWGQFTLGQGLHYYPYIMMLPQFCLCYSQT